MIEAAGLSRIAALLLMEAKKFLLFILIGRIISMHTINVLSWRRGKGEILTKMIHGAIIDIFTGRCFFHLRDISS